MAPAANRKPSPSGLDHAFSPTAAGVVEDELLHRQAIEKLVGDDDSRAIRDVLEIVMPRYSNRRLSKGSPLGVLQRL